MNTHTRLFMRAKIRGLRLQLSNSRRPARWKQTTSKPEKTGCLVCYLLDYLLAGQRAVLPPSPVPDRRSSTATRGAQSS